jgi:hypothetical protein
MAKDINIHGKIDINADPYLRSLQNAIDANQKLQQWHKTLESSVTSVGNTFSKAANTVENFGNRIRDIGKWVAGGAIFKSFIGEWVELNKRTFEFSKAVKVTGQSFRDMQAGISALTKSMQYSNLEATQLYQTFHKGQGVIRLTSSEMQGLAETLANEFGPSVEDVSEAFGKLSSVAAKQSSVIKDLIRGMDPGQMQGYVTALINVRNISEEELNVIQRVARARMFASKAQSDAEKQSLSYQKTVQQLTSQFQQLMVNIGGPLADAFKSVAEYIKPMIVGLNEFLTKGGGIEKIGAWLKAVGKEAKWVADGLKWVAKYWKEIAIAGGIALGGSKIIGAASALQGWRANRAMGAATAARTGAPTGILETVKAGLGLGSGGARGMAVYVTNLPALGGGNVSGPGMDAATAGGKGGLLRRFGVGALKVGGVALASYAASKAADWGGEKLKEAGYSRAGAGLKAGVGIASTVATFAAFGSVIPGVGTAFGALAGAAYGVYENFGDLKTAIFGVSEASEELEDAAKAAAEATASEAKAKAEEEENKQKGERLGAAESLAGLSSGEAGFAGQYAATKAAKELYGDKGAERFKTGQMSAGEMEKVEARATSKDFLKEAGVDLNASQIGEEVAKKIDFSNIGKELEVSLGQAAERSALLVRTQLDEIAQSHSVITGRIEQEIEYTMKWSGDLGKAAELSGELNNRLQERLQGERVQVELAERALTKAGGRIDVEGRLAELRAKGADIGVDELVAMNKLDALLASVDTGLRKTLATQEQINSAQFKIVDAYNVQIGLIQQQASLQEAQMDLFKSMNLGLGPTLEMQMELLETYEKQKGSLKEQLSQLRATDSYKKGAPEARKREFEILQQITAAEKKQVELTKTLREGYLDAMQTFTNAEGTFSKMITSREMGTAEMMRTLGSAGGARLGQTGAGGTAPVAKWGAGGSLQFKGDWNEMNKQYGVHYGAPQMLQANTAGAIQQSGAGQFYGGQSSGFVGSGGAGLTAAQGKRMGDLQQALITSPGDKGIQKELGQLQATAAGSDPVIAAIKAVENAIREGYSTTMIKKEANIKQKTEEAGEGKKAENQAKETAEKLADEMNKHGKDATGAKPASLEKENDAKINTSKKMQEMLEAADQADLSKWDDYFRETEDFMSGVNTSGAGFGRGATGAAGAAGTTGARAGTVMNADRERDYQGAQGKYQGERAKVRAIMEKGKVPIQIAELMAAGKMPMPEGMDGSTGEGPAIGAGGERRRRPKGGRAGTDAMGDPNVAGSYWEAAKTRDFTQTGPGIYDESGRKHVSKSKADSEKADIQNAWHTARGKMISAEYSGDTGEADSQRKLMEDRAGHMKEYDENVTVTEKRAQGIYDESGVKQEVEPKYTTSFDKATGEMIKVYKDESSKGLEATQKVEQGTQDVVKAQQEGAARVADSIGGATAENAIVSAVCPIGAQAGGLVPGMGIGDVMPAMLEPGEFVMNKRSAAAFAPLLSAMNVGKFQAGGFAGIAPSPGLAMAGGGGVGSPRFNISVRGDTKRNIMNNVNKQLGDVLSDMMTTTGTTGRYYDLQKG